LPSALQLLLMANKTKIVRHTHRPMYENIYTRGDEKQWKCWAINKNETKKKKKRSGMTCLSPLLRNIKRQFSWWESHHLHQHHNGTSFINSGKKKRKKKPLSIHFCWLDVGVESGHNQRCLSLSWKLFIFQELPKGFEQNWRHIRQSKNKNRMIRFKFFFPLICTTGRMYIEGKKYC
jgi:hypothetical protein